MPPNLAQKRIHSPPDAPGATKRLSGPRWPPVEPAKASAVNTDPHNATRGKVSEAPPLSTPYESPISPAGSATHSRKSSYFQDSAPPGPESPPPTPLQSPMSAGGIDGDSFANSITNRIDGEVELRVEISHLERIIKQKSDIVASVAEIDNLAFRETKLASLRQDEDKLRELRSRLTNFQVKSKQDLRKRCSQLLATAKPSPAVSSFSTSAPQQDLSAKFEAFIQETNARDREIALQFEAMNARLNQTEKSRSALETECKLLRDLLAQQCDTSAKQQKKYDQSLLSLQSIEPTVTTAVESAIDSLTKRLDVSSLRDDSKNQKEAVKALTESHKSLILKYEGTEGMVRALDDQIGGLETAGENAQTLLASLSQSIESLQTNLANDERHQPGDSAVSELQKRVKIVEKALNEAKHSLSSEKPAGDTSLPSNRTMIHPLDTNVEMAGVSDIPTAETPAATAVMPLIEKLQAELGELRSKTHAIQASEMSLADSAQLRTVATELRQVAGQHTALEQHLAALKASYNNIQTQTMYHRIVSEMSQRIPVDRVERLEGRIRQVEVLLLGPKSPMIMSPSSMPPNATPANAMLSGPTRRPVSTGPGPRAGPPTLPTQGQPLQVSGQQARGLSPHQRTMSLASAQRAQQPSPLGSVQVATHPTVASVSRSVSDPSSPTGVTLPSQQQATEGTVYAPGQTRPSGTQHHPVTTRAPAQQRPSGTQPRPGLQHAPGTQNAPSTQQLPSTQSQDPY